jgi:hypothetical protein
MWWEIVDSCLQREELGHQYAKLNEENPFKVL